MIRPLENSSEDKSYLGAFARDFDRRFLDLLSYEFRKFPSVLALSIDESANMGARLDTSYQPRALSRAELGELLSPFDLKRLESYANNMLDYHVVLDLVPRLAMLYFTERLKSDIKLTGMCKGTISTVLCFMTCSF